MNRVPFALAAPLLLIGCGQDGASDNNAAALERAAEQSTPEAADMLRNAADRAPTSRTRSRRRATPRPPPPGRSRRRRRRAPSRTPPATRCLRPRSLRRGTGSGILPRHFAEGWKGFF